MLASTLALLLVSATATAFVTTKDVQAEDPQPINELKILKKLKIAKGVKTPNKTFTFNFTKVQFGTETTDLENKMPSLTDATVQYESTKDTLQDGKESINKEATVDLSKVTWPKAGQYTYSIKEADVQNDTTDGFVGEYKKSAAEYKISFMVVEQNGKKVVTSIYLQRTANDGNDDSAKAENAKTPYNPTPVPGGVNENNGLSFTNIYNKKVNGLDDNNKENEDIRKRGLQIKKTVPATASPAFKGQNFRFKVIVKAPSTVKNVNNEIHFTTSDATVPKTTTNAYGDNGFEFNLKGDQWAALSNIYIGSTVTVIETNPQGAASANISGQHGTTAITVDSTGEHANFKTTSFILEEGGNFVQFENVEQTPTGVLMDMLPFIILAIVAIGGIYYFKRSRSRSHQA